MAWLGPIERGEVLWERRGTCWNNLSLLYVWAVMSTSSKPGDGKSRKTCLEPQKNKALCFPRESLGLTWGEWSLREQKPRRCSLSGQCSLVANHLGRQPQVVTDNAETWGCSGEAVVASLSAGWLRSPWALAVMKAPTGLTFPGLQSIPEMI